MITFAIIRSLPDARPLRLQPVLKDEPSSTFSAHELDAVFTARHALPKELRQLPLRLPVSPQSLASYRNRKTLPAGLAGSEFGLVPWASGWLGAREEPAWKTILQAGASVSLLEFGTGYASLAPLKRLPIDMIEIAAHLAEHVHDSADPTVNPHVSSIAQLAMAMQLSVCARLEASETPPESLFRNGVTEFVYLPKPPPGP